jgi:hypothetical protein
MGAREGKRMTKPDLDQSEWLTSDRGLKFGFTTASPLLAASSRTLHQEAENEHAMTTPQRTAATHACYRAIGSRLGREFDPNNFVLCPAVRTIERHRLWIRHDATPPNRRSPWLKGSRPIDGQIRD